VAGNAETDASATSVPQEEATPTDEPVSTEATEVPTSLPSPTSTEATAVPTSLPSPTSTEVTPTETATVTPVPPQEEQVDTMANSGNPDLDYAQVIFVKATQNSAGLWRFDTTVRHNDQGWDDYADAWQVVNPQTNEILAERILLHPHDNEQPFTRSQDNIEIPPDITQVLVRAKDNVEGFGGQEVLVDLTASEGKNFEVVYQ
jgi:hypothetical protein